MNFSSRNEITGAWLKSKKTNDNYRAGFDAIFGKKTAEPVEETEKVEELETPVTEKEEENK